MPGVRHAPRLETEIAKLQRRVSQLERQLGAVIETRIMPTPFSIAGPLDDQIGIESPAWRPVHPVSIDLVVPQVLVAPSGGDLNIVLVKYGPGGGFVMTLTIPDGETYVEIAAPFQMGMGASLTAQIADANGAESLSISMLPRLLF